MGQITIESSGEKENLETFHKRIKEFAEASAKVNEVLMENFKAEVFEKKEDK